MTLAAFNLVDQLAALHVQSLKRTPRALSHGVTPTTWRGGKAYLNFSSNDYLGLTNHPALRDAVFESLNQHGVGAGAAHLITGHTDLHERLEQRLAQVSGYPRALLFSTGYMANIGVLGALLTPKSTLYQDKLNHASLIDGAQMCGAIHRRYPHQDLATLERLLKSDQSALKLIATDQVFSMDGTEANLTELRLLAEKYNTALMIDDAHGFGMRAEALPKVDIYMATLGKAVGTFGAFVAGSSDLIEFLQSRARTFCFTTATPPILAAATLAALDVIESETWRRERLASHVVRLRTALLGQGWQITASQTAIQPIIIGSAEKTLALSKQLEVQGILAVAIRPPTVAKGTSRLRITLSAAHSDQDVERLIEVLGVLRP